MSEGERSRDREEWKLTFKKAVIFNIEKEYLGYSNINTVLKYSEIHSIGDK